MFSRLKTIIVLQYLSNPRKFKLSVFNVVLCVLIYSFQYFATFEVSNGFKSSFFFLDKLRLHVLPILIILFYFLNVYKWSYVPVIYLFFYLVFYGVLPLGRPNDKFYYNLSALVVTISLILVRKLMDRKNEKRVKALILENSFLSETKRRVKGFEERI